jgi:hypothetical protein
VSLEISRRDFLQVIFKTTSAAAISGLLPYWPKDALNRPFADPVELGLDVDNYLIDINFDWCYRDIPTFREWLCLNGLNPKEQKQRLEEDKWRFEHIIADQDNWDIDEIQEFLESDVELDDMGNWEAMSYTEYGPGIDIYEHMKPEDSGDLGLYLTDCCHPGSSFVGVQFLGDPKELNHDLSKLGFNMRIKESADG